MKAIRSNTYRFVICIFFGLCITAEVKAQTNIGVRWIIPDNNAQLDEQLTFLKAHHIDLVIVDEIPSSDQALAFERFRMPFIIDLGNQFLTEEDFGIRTNQLLADAGSIANQFDTLAAFSGILAYKHSFPTDSLRNLYSGHFIQQGDSILRNNQLLGKVLVFSKNDVRSLHQFKDKLEQKLPYVIVDYDWLKNTVEIYPEIKSLFLAKENLDPKSFPLPKAPEQQPSSRWSVIVLLLLWISLAVNIGISPTYLETIPRYFTAHRFFVDDIMSYRERSSVSALFLFFQHAVFGGLTVYILAKTYISNIGLEALYHHVPYFSILGQNYFSLFVLTTILILIVELIALIWLFVPNKEMTHFNQALNLFTWIFHLDFILVTLMITAYFAESNSLFIGLFAILYLLVWFSSFNITAFAASKKLGMNRNSYLRKTILLHTIVSLGVLTLTIVFNGWWDVLELVINI